MKEDISHFRHFWVRLWLVVEYIPKKNILRYPNKIVGGEKSFFYIKFMITIRLTHGSYYNVIQWCLREV